MAYCNIIDCSFPTTIVFVVLSPRVSRDSSHLEEAKSDGGRRGMDGGSGGGACGV